MLEKINFPSDLKKIPPEKLTKVCEEIRQFLIKTISKTGGHFGSNLGVVELTVALHYVFDTPTDLLFWDVGHQTYAHKILTGRKNRMNTIRKKNGLAPFPKREESEYDILSVGHASTSISAALGMAIANKIDKKKRKTIAIIGDGALGGGMALEALNHAGDTGADLLVILNDNKMSISSNVGALEKYLTRLISSPSYVSMRKKGRKILKNVPRVEKIVRKAESHAKGMITPGTLFEELGFEYYGPINGHDVETLVNVLKNLKKIKGPRFLHIITKKGKGYLPAEKDSLSLHAVHPFNLKTGEKEVEKQKKITYTEIFSKWVVEKAQKDKNLCVVTPAMCDGAGLREFSKKFPERFFDVGIAEQHAVTFAVGLAIQGKKPIVSIYSSFLQRAFDQVIHDVALQNLDILFAIDRAGIVGPDGATHNGSFDLSFLRIIPNLVIGAPSSENECWAMLSAGYEHIGPVAIRYPRSTGTGDFNPRKKEVIEIGKAKILRQGEKIVILAFGAMVEKTKKVANNLDATLVNMRFIKPLDEKLLLDLAKKYNIFITIEDNVISGGAGSTILEFFASKKKKIKLLQIGLPDKFLDHGTREEILEKAELSEEKIMQSIKKFMKS